MVHFLKPDIISSSCSTGLSMFSSQLKRIHQLRPMAKLNRSLLTFALGGDPQVVKVGPQDLPLKNPRMHISTEGLRNKISEGGDSEES